MFRLYGHLQAEIYMQLKLNRLTTDPLYFRMLVILVDFVEQVPIEEERHSEHLSNYVRSYNVFCITECFVKLPNINITAHLSYANQ
jgi:hypothetical protein